jgi:hypothetical protein
LGKAYRSLSFSLCIMHYVLCIWSTYRTSSLEVTRQWQLNIYCFLDDMFRQTWLFSGICRILCDNILQSILYILQYLRFVSLPKHVVKIPNCDPSKTCLGFTGRLIIAYKLSQRDDWNELDTEFRFNLRGRTSHRVQLNALCCPVAVRTSTPFAVSSQAVSWTRRSVVGLLASTPGFGQSLWYLWWTK